MENELKEKIETRLKELRATREQTIADLNAQAKNILAPIDAAIGELERLLPKQEDNVIT